MVMTALGPVIAHNCTQASANDILRKALRQLDAEGYAPVLHVHDEIVLETDDPDGAIDAMRRIMCAGEPGLPMNIEVHAMQRYGKG